MSINIAIDGCSGSGKSTLAKQLAEKLGYIYIDTGALYRAITLKVLKEIGENFTEKQLKKILKSTKIKIVHAKDGNLVYLDGQDVSDNIREPKISNFVSIVAKQPVVRTYLVAIQRKNAKKANSILDGRDIGTVVLPKADIKIFLTANLKERAKRRWQELKDKSINISLKEVEENLEQRDLHDSSRQTSPLKKADEAVEVDSSSTTPEEKLEIVLNIIQNRLWEKRNYTHRLFRYICFLFFKTFFRIEFLYENYEPLKSFSGLVASNHCSNLDPVAVGLSVPFHCFYFAKESLMRNFIAHKILTICNCIAINRSSPTPKSIKTVIRKLKENKSVVVFPEGTRSPDGIIKEGKIGAGMFAYRSGSPVLPAYVAGSYEAFPKSRKIFKPTKVHVVVGTPYFPNKKHLNDISTKEQYKNISNEMIKKIKDLKYKFENNRKMLLTKK